MDVESRSPSAEAIYRSPLRTNRKDPPSPLLLVNGQVHHEVVELVRKYPITVQVTRQGSHFDGLAETCFIAQRRSRGYSEISHLWVDIWPPHPDRPIDLFYIWLHLQELQIKLCEMPLLKQVSFFFRNNKMATWKLNGEPIDLLNLRSSIKLSTGMINDDVTSIMDIFARVRAEKAWFYMPRGLTPGETTDCIRDHLRSPNAMMMSMKIVSGA